MKTLTLFALLVLTAVPLAAHAGSDLSKLSTMKNPGEWQMTITQTMSVPGTKMSIPPKTMTKKECVTQADLKKLDNIKPVATKDMTCTMTKKDLTGKTLTFVMDCKGKKGTMHINGTSVFETKDAGHSHFDIQGKTNSMPIHVTVDTQSKRIGECTPASNSSSGK